MLGLDFFISSTFENLVELVINNKKYKWLTHLPSHLSMS